MKKTLIARTKALQLFQIRETLFCFLTKSAGSAAPEAPVQTSEDGVVSDSITFIQDTDLTNYILQQSLNSNSDLVNYKLDSPLLYATLDVLDMLGFIVRKCDGAGNQKFLGWQGWQRVRNRWAIKESKENTEESKDDKKKSSTISLDI